MGLHAINIAGASSREYFRDKDPTAEQSFIGNYSKKLIRRGRNERTIVVLPKRAVTLSFQ
jgi:hypothetical protein